jgi:hypothetical protein
MSLTGSTHGNMTTSEIKPQILHNRPMTGPMPEIKLSSTGCSTASHLMNPGEQRVELLSHYRYGGYGYHHLYPHYGGYGYPYYRRGYPYRCGYGPYPWFY